MAESESYEDVIAERDSLKAELRKALESTIETAEEIAAEQSLDALSTAIDSNLSKLDEIKTMTAERDEAREELAIARMEREWLLGAWAAATETPQAEAEAEFLKWSSKWRDMASGGSTPSGKGER